jgi:cytochrome c biogenesis protein ResB
MMMASTATTVSIARIIASLCTLHRWPAALHKLWAHKHRPNRIIAERHDQHVTVQIDRGEHKNKEKRESHANQNRRS